MPGSTTAPGANLIGSTLTPDFLSLPRDPGKMSEPNEIAARCQSIARKAKWLEFAYASAIGLGFRCEAPFGAETHRFRLRTKLAPWKLRRFQKTAGIQIPDCYREFLRTVGNGGAGPGRGLCRIGWLRPGRSLRQCFITGEGISRAQAAAPANPCRALAIANHGCGSFDWLVCTGEYAGRIAGEGESGTPEPTLELLPPRDFLTWYEEWQNEALTRLGLSSMGSGLSSFDRTSHHSAKLIWAYVEYVRFRSLLFALSAASLLVALAADRFNAMSRTPLSAWIGGSFLILILTYFGIPRRLLRPILDRIVGKR